MFERVKRVFERGFLAQALQAYAPQPRAWRFFRARLPRAAKRTSACWDAAGARPETRETPPRQAGTLWTTRREPISPTAASGRPHAPQHSEQVDLDEAAYLLLGKVGEPAVVPDPGVVEPARERSVVEGGLGGSRVVGGAPYVVGQTFVGADLGRGVWHDTLFEQVFEIPRGS